MRSCFEPSCAYALPYLLQRDSGGRPFQNVLIIGAGSGNDVSRALQWKAAHVDAVEIDPAILEIGKYHHPDEPYGETKPVAVHQNDGRNFLRSTKNQYDLIVYALVDSLVLQSGYSNIRLESYLFTKEAFTDAKRCLKPDGLFVVYNYFRQGWIVTRIAKILREVFDTDPLILTMPYQPEVQPEERSSSLTMFIAGEVPALERLRKAFHWPAQKDHEEAAKYWVDLKQITGPDAPNGFTQRRPTTIQKPGNPLRRRG